MSAVEGPAIANLEPSKALHDLFRPRKYLQRLQIGLV